MKQDKMWEVYQNDPDLDSVGCRSGGRIEYVAENIPALPSICVLNIGVGKGELERILCNRGVQVFSLDPSETSILSLREYAGIEESRAKIGYSQEIPYSDNSFDYVIMTEVLEHLDDSVLERTLKEVRRVLKQEGVFIGTVPADEDLSSAIAVCPRCGEKFHRWGHVQSFTKSHLIEVLECRFDSVLVKRKYFVDYSRMNWKGKVVGALKSVQALLDIKGGSQNFYFEARCV